MCTDWEMGESYRRSRDQYGPYTVPEGLFKSVELGAYYTDSNAKQRFYTDLTGYDTTKARGVVYVKKTF